MACVFFFPRFGHPVISEDAFRLDSYNWEEHSTVRNSNLIGFLKYEFGYAQSCGEAAGELVWKSVPRAV
jgi:hypothetical protein